MKFKIIRSYAMYVQVTKEDKKKALDEQFGGEDENPPPAPGFNNAPTFKFTKYSNAYMLVYIREVSGIDNIEVAALHL